MRTGALPACVFMYCMSSWSLETRRGAWTPGVGVKMVGSHPVGPGSQIEVLWKSKQLVLLTAELPVQFLHVTSSDTLPTRYSASCLSFYLSFPITPPFNYT